MRVIYLHTPEAKQIDLIAVYSKDEQDDLTRSEVALLCVLAKKLREELRRGHGRSKWK